MHHAAGVARDPREKTMTKKHFKALAEALKRARTEVKAGDTADYAIDGLQIAIMDICDAANPRFDRDRVAAAARRE
jgi:hypothetical protein